MFFVLRIIVSMALTVVSYASTNECSITCQVALLEKKVQQLETEVVELKRHITPRRTWF